MLDYQSRELARVFLKSDVSLKKEPGGIAGVIPLLYTHYPDHEQSPAQWAEFIKLVKDTAGHSASYTQFVFSLEDNSVNMIECILDVSRMVLPKNDFVCSEQACPNPNCKKKTLYEMALQTRSFDEEATVVTKCLSCGYSNI